MTELKHSPVPGIFCGLRMFVLAFSASIAIYSLFEPYEAAECAAYLLLFSFSYAVVFACTETVRSKTVHFIILALCVGFDILLVPTMPLGPALTSPYCAMPHSICIFLLAVMGFIHRTRPDTSGFSGIKMLAHVAILVVIAYIADESVRNAFVDISVRNALAEYSARLSGEEIADIIALNAAADEKTRTILYYSALSYIPLSVASIFAEKGSEFFSRLKGRSTQPTAIFHLRITARAVGIVLVLSTMLLMLPIVDFSFLRSIAANGFVGFMDFIGKFTYVPEHAPGEPREVRFTNKTGERAPFVEVPSFADELCIAVLCVAALALLIILAVKFVKLLRRYMSEEHIKRIPKTVKTSQFDTLEKLDKTPVSTKREKLTQAQTNALKVRHMYKKRIGKLFKVDSGKLTDSKSPDEIAALAAQRGYDISELTRIYKKARYSDSCTASDVAAARKTKAVII